MRIFFKFKKIFFILLFIPNVLFSQVDEWKDVGINDWYKEYKYEYKYRAYFNLPGDTNNYYFVENDYEKSDVGLVSGQIEDNFNQMSFGILVQVIDSTATITDFDGYFALELLPGKYILNINSLHMNELNIDIEVKEGKNLQFNIFLGYDEGLTIYVINSKKKLSEEESKEIMECLRGQYIKNRCIGCGEILPCMENSTFFIGIEI